MGSPGESTAAERVRELAQLRLLAAAADAWARWRRERSGEPASSQEVELLAALDRLDAVAAHSSHNLLVLCSGCRRTRDDAEWVDLEGFLTRKAGIEFTHGLCPECMERLYPHHPPEPG